MRAALALLAFPFVDAALKTYANASTELTNLEHFFDAHLQPPAPILVTTTTHTAPGSIHTTPGPTHSTPILDP